MSPTSGLLEESNQKQLSTHLVEELLGSCTFAPSGTPVDCAVSGGADSVSLLILARAAGCEVTAFHVDHGLRPGADQEATFVAALAERFGATFEPLAVRVEPGPNLEARARAARYGIMPAGVLTGHTADDQVETILANLLRGAGIDGLAGMRATTRPILALRRHQTRSLCELHGITPFEDPSNRDSKFLRNRIRHEVVPLLDDVARRDVVPVIARQAGTLRAESDFMETTSAHLDATDVRALVAAGDVMARRAIRRWLRAAMDAEKHPPDTATVDRVLDVVRGGAKACDVGNGLRARRSKGRLFIEGQT